VDVETRELAHLLTNVAMSVEQSAKLLAQATDMHAELTALHGQIVDALVELERLLRTVEDGEGGPA
jgi:hypothetical protein